MKALLLFALVLSSAYAKDTVTSFECLATEADNKMELKFKFAIKNIEKKAEEVLTKKGEEGEDPNSPVSVQHRKFGSKTWIKSTKPYNHSRLGLINGGDFGGFYTTEIKGEKVLTKNGSDTCVQVDLTLYKNSGYQNGYLASNNMCDPEKKDRSYSTVTCKVKTK